MTTISHMFIFDVDGVICSLKEKNPNPTILTYIADELKKNHLVALNTGRSLDWVVKRAAKTLINNSNIKPFLRNFIVVGEKGGVWSTFDKNGDLQEHVDKSLSVSLNLKKEIGKIVASKYSNSMFLDEGKKTAISVEMNDGYDLQKYQQDQNSLIIDINSLIKKYKLEDALILTPNPIAIDVDTKGVGKHLGIRRILDILESKKMKAKTFITIGDLPADFKMAEELHRKNLPVEFVFVGDKRTLTKKTYPFKITFTKNQYEKGTLEFLKSLSAE